MNAEQFMLLIISEECYENYFNNFDFFNFTCFKQLLSKGLGIGIICGSLLVKVPQILKIQKNKSAVGISIFSVLLDLLAISFFVAYSFVKQFPFTAWGDGGFLGVQTATIAALVLYYNREYVKLIVFLIFYALLVHILMGGIATVDYLHSLQALNIPILLAGKLSQAVTNYSNKSTGQLSAVTSFMLFFGALARIFTSIQETGDFMMIFTFVNSAFANGVIAAQVLYYWNSDKQVQEDVKRKIKKQKKIN